MVLHFCTYLTRRSPKLVSRYSRLIHNWYSCRMLQDIFRIDGVWDVNREDSLKAQTRQKRGAGNQLRVGNNTSIPVNWINFLRVDANKDGLFRLLINPIQGFQPAHRKQIISTHGHNAVLSLMSDISDLFCTQEEANTRLLFHASHAFHRGFSRVMIHVTDNDVVVFTIAVSSALQDCEICVAFRFGSRQKGGLLLTHPISGYDTVSSFYGIGKRTAWTIWHTMPNFNLIFVCLSRAPTQTSSDEMNAIEKYVVLLYQRTAM